MASKNQKQNKNTAKAAVKATAKVNFKALTKLQKTIRVGDTVRELYNAKRTALVHNIDALSDGRVYVQFDEQKGVTELWLDQIEIVNVKKAKPETKVSKSKTEKNQDQVKAFAFPTSESIKAAKEAAKTEKKANKKVDPLAKLGTYAVHPDLGPVKVIAETTSKSDGNKRWVEVCTKFGARTDVQLRELKTALADDIQDFHMQSIEDAKLSIEVHADQVDEPSVPDTDAAPGGLTLPVVSNLESVKFEILPLLAQFRSVVDGDQYLKVGNSTAIHLTHSTLDPKTGNCLARPLVVGKYGKQRFKKSTKVFPVN